MLKLKLYNSMLLKNPRSFKVTNIILKLRNFVFFLFFWGGEMCLPRMANKRTPNMKPIPSALQQFYPFPHASSIQNHPDTCKHVADLF